MMAFHPEGRDAIYYHTINTSRTLSNTYPIKLNDFMEYIDRKPLFPESIISHKNVQYRTQVHYWGYLDQNRRRPPMCFVFICISPLPIKPFAKKPSDVANLIEEGVIIIDKLFNYDT